MLAARRPMQRALDFSAIRGDGRAALATAIVTLLRRRQNPMREREIRKYFTGTPDAFVVAALTDLCVDDRVTVTRSSLNRNRCVMEYSAVSPQETCAVGINSVE